MALTGRFGCLLVLVFLLVNASFRMFANGDDGFSHCESIVRSWADSAHEKKTKDVGSSLKDLLFFLHVPRTGGRTYFHCFLRKLYTSDQECPRSYDRLRFDPSKPNCRLMVTHDDYSLMSKLSKDRTSLVTILRRPVDRIFSTYEFSLEVAARFLVHPNLTSATQMSVRIRPKSRGVSTLDIWPWKYLVPWMREDLFARRDARKLGRLRRAKDTINPYDMEDMIMPLHEFINDPLAHEIIHNGATFQVAGLTNNSHTAESHEVRNCVRKHPELGRIVLQVAKERLDNMIYIGLTEEHKKSAKMFAELVGRQVLSQSEALSSKVPPKAPSETETNSSDPGPEADELIQDEHDATSQEASDISSTADDEPGKQDMTVGKLMEVYEECVANLRKSQSSRRVLSLKRIAPANFSKEARNLVPSSILQEIMELNSLDMELYNHARNIFINQEHLMRLSEEKILDSPAMQNVKTEMECQFEKLRNIFGCSLWKVSLPVASLLLIVLVMFFITTGRRASKLKI